MAQVNIPESVGRALYNQHFQRPKDFWLVNTQQKNSLAENLQLLQQSGANYFVVKPDHIISKRKKHNLLGLRLTLPELEDFIAQKTRESFQGRPLTRFIIMPFVEHSTEYYLAFSTYPGYDQIAFSVSGGIDIEENWQQVQTLKVPVLAELDPIELMTLVQTVEDEGQRTALLTYIQTLWPYFRENGFAFLEINPLTITDGQVQALDFKGRLDSCAFFQLQKKLDIFGLLENLDEAAEAEEREVHSLDALTFASLKLTILNRNGRIWPMVAGGGASMIYFDSLVDQGLGSEIGFYGEYSGNPPAELLYQYTHIVLKLLLASEATGKVLLITGANANFTDIAQTFKGIAQALEEQGDELRRQEITILVRRGGPHVEEGFATLQALAQQFQLDLKIEGVEQSLTHILEYIPTL